MSLLNTTSKHRQFVSPAQDRSAQHEARSSIWALALTTLHAALCLSTPQSHNGGEAETHPRAQQSQDKVRSSAQENKK